MGDTSVRTPPIQPVQGPNLEGAASLGDSLGKAISTSRRNKRTKGAKAHLQGLMEKHRAEQEKGKYSGASLTGANPEKKRMARLKENPNWMPKELQLTREQRQMFYGKFGDEGQKILDKFDNINTQGLEAQVQTLNAANLLFNSMGRTSVTLKGLKTHAERAEFLNKTMDQNSEGGPLGRSMNRLLRKNYFNKNGVSEFNAQNMQTGVDLGNVGGEYVDKVTSYKSAKMMEASEKGKEVTDRLYATIEQIADGLNGLSKQDLTAEQAQRREMYLGALGRARIMLDKGDRDGSISSLEQLSNDLDSRGLVSSGDSEAEASTENVNLPQLLAEQRAELTDKRRLENEVDPTLKYNPINADGINQGLDGGDNNISQGDEESPGIGDGSGSVAQETAPDVQEKEDAGFPKPGFEG